MSCQTTPNDSRRIVFSKSELQVVSYSDVEFHIQLSKFFELSGDYAGYDINLKSDTTIYNLPTNILISNTFRSLWVFPTYEKTEFESIECIEWAYVVSDPTIAVWQPLSKVLALSGTTDSLYSDLSKMIQPIMLRNLTPHDVKVKILITN